MNKAIVVIVDYGMGNLRSVEKAIQSAGANARISSNASDIINADKIVLPGVGAFGHASRELSKRGLVQPIIEKISEGAPYLGICLGLQLLFESSQEGGEPGLGVLKGKVLKFKSDLKIPHMGWNQISITSAENPLFRKLNKDTFLYFVHSYYAFPRDKSVIASTTSYGIEFCSSVWKDNIFATQFHPEKSQLAGQQIIKNFLTI